MSRPRGALPGGGEPRHGHTRAAGLAASNGDDLDRGLRWKQLVHRQTAKGMTTDETFGGEPELSPYSRIDIESQT